MANTDKPYRRVGANSWKELLDQVNDELENPPAGCDPLEPIEVPDKPHRWAKSDVREVHDRLDEMPGDCFEWEEIPDLWKISIIEEIEEQLENAWCECEECAYPCENARSNTREEIFLDSISTDSGDCTTCSASQGDLDACKAVRDNDFTPALQARGEAEDTYIENFLKACDLEAEIEALEEEIEALEERKNEACGDPEQEALCQQLTQELEDKNDELEEKKEEFEEAKSERDDAESEMLSQGQIATNAALSAGGICAGNSLGLVPLSGTAPTDVSCNDSENESGILPDCFIRDPLRCTVTWTFQQKFTYYLGNCYGGQSGPWGGRWITITGGHYDLNGAAVITSWPSRWGGCFPDLHHATCFSNKCSGACGEGSSPCTPGSQGLMEYRLLIFYPREFEPVNCDNQPCGSEEEPPGEEGGGGDEGGGEEEG